jgi:acetyltransferase-like isoleucine patch superfamily enzyme
MPSVIKSEMARNKPSSFWLGIFRNHTPKWVKTLSLSIFYYCKTLTENLIEYLSEIIVSNIPSHSIRIGWYRHVCRIKIGKKTSIHRKFRFFRPEKITIGDHSVINYGVLFDGRGGLNIGNNVSVSEGVVILTGSHDIDSENFCDIYTRIIIEDYVFIGSYARILQGVTIKKGAVVGVGAVVTKDVEEFTVVGGIPAHFIKNRNRDLSYEINYRKRFG